jgi:hypothetical protein
MVSQLTFGKKNDMSMCYLIGLQAWPPGLQHQIPAIALKKQLFPVPSGALRRTNLSKTWSKLGIFSELPPDKGLGRPTHSQKKVLPLTWDNE